MEAKSMNKSTRFKKCYDTYPSFSANVYIFLNLRHHIWRIFSIESWEYIEATVVFLDTGKSVDEFFRKSTSSKLYLSYGSRFLSEILVTSPVKCLWKCLMILNLLKRNCATISEHKRILQQKRCFKKEVQLRLVTV